MSSLDIVKKMQINDEFIELVSYASIIVRCTEAPVRSETGAWRWKGVRVDNGQEIDYLITEGYEHYGPKLYPVSDFPVYM